MPIYAYRCESCGHAKDVLRKVSDPVLTTCPSCHAESFRKQLTAAGFQLKGSGWYVTDFRGNCNGNGGSASNAGAAAPKADGAAAPAADSPAAAPAADSASSSSSGGGACGGSCACH